MKQQATSPNWDNAEQLEIKFTWTNKVIISMRQLMQEARAIYERNTFEFLDGSKKRCTSWKKATREVFAKYRSWKQLFNKSGNIHSIPSFVYFID